MDLETKRLYLRRLQSADAADLYRTVGDAQGMRHWHPGPDTDIPATQKRIGSIENHWHKHGFGDWGVCEKEADRLVGFAGLHYIAGIAEVNLGYAFEKSRWRRGYGYETCRAVLDYGLGELELDLVVAVIAPQNQASIRLAKKCGLRLWKRFTWSGLERMAYQISRLGTS
jgi:[ribosomal protein S5]-alanine N-acetyltransferase